MEEPKPSIPELIEHFKNRKFQTKNGAALLEALEFIQALLEEPK